MLSKKITLEKFLQELKSHSSKWIKEKGDPFYNFFWQDGYGAFSVSPSHVAGVVEYISNQHEHHLNVTFKEEFLRILERDNVEYDERYLWD